MPTRSVPKAEWGAYFDWISKQIAKQMASARVEISVEGMDLGDQPLTSKMLLEGITYDPASDMITFFLPGVSHNIASPREVWVDAGLEGLRSIQVVDSEGRQQIAVLHGLLELPPA